MSLKPNEEYIPGVVVIQSTVGWKRNHAINLHKKWLSEPNDENKRAYAHALLDYAKETRNKRYEAHARVLLAETE